MPTRERTSVIVIRMWLESDHEHALRARVTAVRDLDEGEPENAVASSVDEIVEIVRRFASAFAGTGL